MSFVEVLVTAAIIALVFGGLMASFQLMVSLIGKSKAEAGALALANGRLEYIRSLDYNEVGTVGGIPDGPIPQTASTTLNGVSYEERILIEYVDDPADGEGTDDSNLIVADYKLVKVEYSWDNKGDTETVTLQTNIVPKGVETTAGGGTIRVNVFDVSVQPVSGAEVRVYNDTGTSTIDTVRYTNAEGVALISGAPALASYQITVTKSGYSTDQTYSASSTNPNPSPPHVSVLESEVSTVNFQIDELAALSIRTIGEPTTESFSDTFNDGSGIGEASGTSLGSGHIALSGGPPYAGSGTIRSVDVTPTAFSSWDTFTFTFDTPPDTGAMVQLYSATGTGYARVPDGDLPGNSSGFATGTISLTGLDPIHYPTLALLATLTTDDASSTPLLLDWGISYTVNEPPIGGVDVTFTSEKSIGTDTGSSPVPKYKGTHTSDTGGAVVLTGLEWGVYGIAPEGSSYDIAEACGNIPYTLVPAADDTLTLTLATDAAYTLRVYVENTGGDPIAGADVTLSRTGFSDSDTTSSCGGAFFNNGLANESDYQLEVNAPGYLTETVEDVVIDGDNAQVITLSN